MTRSGVKVSSIAQISASKGAIQKAMSTRNPEDGRIRKRIAEIDQHIAVLMKERDELIFAERVLERLRDGGDVKSTTAVSVSPASSGEPESIEDALSKLDTKQFS